MACCLSREIALYQHVSLKRVEQVLRLIQLADPLGVGSPSPQEALLVQLEMLNETHPAPALAAQAIQHGLDLLSPAAWS
jgi:RNA polymerase sigma-54 factor